MPALGAIGGMVVPTGIYAWMNRGNSIAMEGWAIPVATDIAFALGLLSVGKPGVEIAPYAVLDSDGLVEIRAYQELVIVTTSMNGNMDNRRSIGPAISVHLGTEQHHLKN